MESSLISALTKSCQQLIISGDHHQLGPRSTLAEEYKLDISFMERKNLSAILFHVKIVNRQDMRTLFVYKRERQFCSIIIQLPVCFIDRSTVFLHLKYSIRNLIIFRLLNVFSICCKRIVKESCYDRYMVCGSVCNAGVHDYVLNFVHDSRWIPTI